MMSRPSKRIQRGSSFALLRRLPRVQPRAYWDPDWFGDDEPDPVWELFQPVDLPEVHPAARHWHWGQNDARVIECSVSGDELELTINHYDFERLAAILCMGQKWSYDHKRLRFRGGPPDCILTAFPVTFSFSGISELSIVRTIEQGLYQKIRHSSRQLGDRLLDVARLECVFSDSNVQRHLLLLNGSRSFRRGKDSVDAYNNEYLVCVECNGLHVKDRSRQGWDRLFRGKYLDLFEAFDPIWPLTGWEWIKLRTGS